MRFTPPEVCPVCGEDVPRNARACPECGSDEQTGWKEGADEIGLAGAPDEEFDYDRFVEGEFGTAGKRTTMQWVWWVVAVILLICFGLAVVS